MANRVSVSMTIGGKVAAAARDRLVELIADYELSIEWGGPAFDAAHLPTEGALIVCAHEVAWGMVPDLEGFCIEQRLPFALWYDSYPGEWTAGRTVFTGDGEPQSYKCDEEDFAMIDRATVEHLGSIDAILADFYAADFVIPPLVISEPASALNEETTNG